MVEVGCGGHREERERERERGEGTPGSKNIVQTHWGDLLQKTPTIKILQQESQFGQCVIDFPKGSESTLSDP